MAEWNIFVDRDLVRDGFDLETIRTEGVEVAQSERLTAAATFVIVVTYLGGKTLDKITDGALGKALDKLLAFAQSREHRLRLEIDERGLDPRVQLIGASVTAIDRTEFDQALVAVKFIEPKVRAILATTEEYIKEIYFVWQDDDWLFTYYLTEGGEVVHAK